MRKEEGNSADTVRRHCEDEGGEGGGVVGPQVRECLQPPEAGRGEEQILPWRLRRECHLTDV